MKICFVSTIYNHIFWPFLCYFFTAFIYFLVFIHHGVSFSQLELAYYKHHFFLKLAMCTECSRVMRFVRISQLSEIDIRLTIHYISRQPNTYIALDRLKKIKSAPPPFYLLNRWFLKCFSVSQRWHRKYAALNHFCLCKKCLHTICLHICLRHNDMFGTGP